MGEVIRPNFGKKSEEKKPPVKATIITGVEFNQDKAGTSGADTVRFSSEFWKIKAANELPDLVSPELAEAVQGFENDALYNSLKDESNPSLRKAAAQELIARQADRDEQTRMQS